MRIFSLILCLLPLVSIAEEAASRTCRILFLKAPDGAPRALYLFDGIRTQEVELPRMNFSEVYQIAPGAVTLWLLPEPPAEPGKVNPGAPSVKVGAGLSDCYLLVASDPSNPVVPVRMSVVDAGSDHFKNGQMLWFNLSDKIVGGVLGKRRLSLEPNARAIVDAPASAREDYKVNLAFVIQGDEAIHPLCETKWRHDPLSRTVMFVIGEPGHRAPRVLGFPDRRTLKVVQEVPVSP